MNGAPALFSADDLCKGAENVLRAGLPALTAALGVDDVYGAIKEWKQLPSTEALTSATATFPAMAITSPGLVNPPTFRRSTNDWAATWRVVAGVYVRGTDHNDVQAKLRDWCGLIRTVLLANKSLDGIANGVTWEGEEYGLFPQPVSARTFGAGAVAVNVLIEGIKLPAIPPAAPLVTETDPHITIKE